MSTEKVMSVYNLQNEEKLGEALKKVEGLKFEKIGAGSNRTEIASYHMSMDEIWTSGQLLESIVKFVQENEGTKVKFYNPEKTVNLIGKEEELRG